MIAASPRLPTRAAWSALGVVLLGVCGEAAELPAKPPPLPRALADDAALNRVHFVGTKSGWAVGDHGVVWRTRDGGDTWELLESGVRCPLHDVHFLTDRVGWIVGGGTRPYTGLGYGMILFTQDGGQTWEQLGSHKLPRLVRVQFFNLQDGVVVGEGTQRDPGGVWVTGDGGETWRAIPGPQTAGWRAADFVSLDSGIVAGIGGRAALVGEGRLLHPRFEPQGLRSFHDAVLNRDDTGWLAGEGGWVLRTENGGVVWEGPPGDIPVNVRDFVDFRAVAAHGHKVWLAGRPGSVVWHSPDSGRSWEKLGTGQTAPIHSLTFPTERSGWAAGAFGTLLRTEDGGASWQAVRGGGRRAALLAVSAQPNGVLLPLLARQSLEYGYRSVACLPVRVASAGSASMSALDSAWHEAVVLAGGSAGEIDWPFSVTRPDLERDRQRLLAEWNRRTEGRLSHVFLSRLVAALRTWRPSVVILEGSAREDALGQLVETAVLQAVEQAADPTRFIEHQELANLPPWRVARVFRRLPPESTGQVHVDRHDFLPRLGCSADAAAAPALALLPESARSVGAQRIAFRSLEVASAAAGGDFFAGLVLPPGGDARRQLADFDEHNSAHARKLTERIRNFQAYAARSLDDPRKKSQLLAELEPLTAGMPAEQAARELLRLADYYRRRGELELVEGTYIELVGKYSQQPEALVAMQWLLQLWTGAEPAWQRVRQTHISGERLSINAEATRERIHRAMRLAAAPPRTELSDEPESDAVEIALAGGTLKVDSDADWRTGTVRQWHTQALRLAALFRRQAPAVYASSPIQYSVAALLRARGSGRLAEGIYRGLIRGDDAAAADATARAELWLTAPLGAPPKPVGICRRAEQPPVLDGLLSDGCWQDARELRLSSLPEVEPGAAAEADPRPALVMLAYDAEYLYLAASVPRCDGVRGDLPQLSGRERDADLSSFDRLSIFLDVDRDYGTCYAFHVDQRGWTAEACWEDAGWNPPWYVAADADRTHWRIEAAIPLAELVPAAPAPQSFWALGVVRTIPAVGRQSWSGAAAGDSPRPETLGLLRFD